MLAPKVAGVTFHNPSCSQIVEAMHALIESGRIHRCALSHACDLTRSIAQRAHRPECLRPCVQVGYLKLVSTAHRSRRCCCTCERLGYSDSRRSTVLACHSGHSGLPAALATGFCAFMRDRHALQEPEGGLKSGVNSSKPSPLPGLAGDYGCRGRPPGALRTRGNPANCVGAARERLPRWALGGGRPHTLSKHALWRRAHDSSVCHTTESGKTNASPRSCG
jgi:hypothetical protein